MSIQPRRVPTVGPEREVAAGHGAMPGRTNGRVPAREAAAMDSTGAILPEDFRIGVATAGFQVEGGFNGPGEPANNWVRWERTGRVEPSGIAVDFWGRAEDYLDLAAGLGCDAFRMSVEWARVEPVEGAIDTAALDRYRTILRACAERGLQPLVTLHHFTHPAWLGEDFWLSASAPARIAEWVRLAVAHLRDSCRHWVTINEPNVLAMGSYLLGTFPPGRRLALTDFLACVDHLLAAHVLAYEAIHEVQPDAVVTTNNASVSLYELDRLLIDLLLARSSGIPRQEVASWLSDRRAAWYAELPAPGALERVLRRVTRQVAGARAEGVGRRGGAGSPSRALAALYGSPHERPLDVVGIDYYDPVASHHLRLPGHRTAGGRTWRPARELWDDRVHPAGLVTYCRANSGAEGWHPDGSLAGTSVWVVENGLCNRVRRGRSYARLDGWDRPAYLRAHVAALVDALDAGLPVGAYYHWSLVDNYEWGSYEPRFGIFGVDRARGPHGFTVLDSDAMGLDAPGTFRRLVAALRQGERAAIVER